jgi:DNA-binding transcriptional LysR family regulator
MDRLTSLTVFGQVVENGGFSAAARRMNMSVTMVSNHVQALEDRLGVRLLNRTTRKVNLTEIGKAYYERSKHILGELDEADRIADSLNSTPRGSLKVFASIHTVRFIAPILNVYLDRYPEVTIDFTIGEGIIDLIEHRIDLAIVTLLPPDSSLVARRLTPWRHIVCCAPSYLGKHPVPQAPADLADHNCLQYAFYPYGNEWRFEAPKGKTQSVRISGNATTNSGELLRHLALSGQGIFLAPSFIVADDIRSGRLVRLLRGYSPVEFAINAAYPHRHHLSSKVRSFIDMLAEGFAEHRKWMNPHDTVETPDSD